MTDYRLLESVQPWIETHMGAALSGVEEGATSVLHMDPAISFSPLIAVKAGEKAVLAVRSEWVERVRAIADDLHNDLLFSTFGAYELARVTLPDGVGVWGPSWYLFADEQTWRPANDDRLVKLEPSELADVDFGTFWHCHPDCFAGFGVYDGKKLVALATVSDRGGPMWEVGMDVLQGAKLTGIGRAIVSAAVGWIIENGKIALASTASFNVPSARTLRSVGLRYVFSAMNGSEGFMRVPPQILGLPYPGAVVQDLYPGWAMNKDIQPRTMS